MNSSSARAAYLWAALNSPWGIVTTWLLLLLALQARLAARLLLSPPAGPLTLGVALGCAAFALITAALVLRGARAGHGLWERRLASASIVVYAVSEVVVRWLLPWPWGQ